MIAAHQQTLDDRRHGCHVGAPGGRRRREALTRAQQRLAYLHPRAVIARERAAMARLDERMTSVRARMAERSAGVHRVAARLDALSPLKVLARGYAIATRDDGNAVRSASTSSVGARCTCGCATRASRPP